MLGCEKYFARNIFLLRVLHKLEGLGRWTLNLVAWKLNELWGVLTTENEPQKFHDTSLNIQQHMWLCLQRLFCVQRVALVAAPFGVQGGSACSAFSACKRLQNLAMTYMISIVGINNMYKKNCIREKQEKRAGAAARPNVEKWRVGCKNRRRYSRGMAKYRHLVRVRSETNRRKTIRKQR